MSTRYFNARQWVGYSPPQIEFMRQLTQGVDTAQTTAEAAATSGDLKTFGVPSSFVWNSDPSGVFTAGNPTRDLVAVFNTDGVQVASRTLRATLTSATGLIAVTAVTTTGEATTYTLIDDGTESVQARITHTISGAITTLSWAAVDLSVAGGTPTSGGGK